MSVGNALAPFALRVLEAGTLVTSAAQGLNFVGAALTLNADGTVTVTVTGGAVGPGTPGQVAIFTAGGTNVEDSIAFQVSNVTYGPRIGVAGRFSVGSPLPPSFESFYLNLYDDTDTFEGSRGISASIFIHDSPTRPGPLFEAVKVETLGTADSNGTRLWGLVTAQTLTGTGKGGSLYGVLLEDGWGDVGGAGEPSGLTTFACIRANPFGGSNPADAAYAFICDMSGVTATELWGLYISGAPSYLEALALGNVTAATTPGNVVGAAEVLDALGASVGYLPIYDTIT